MDQQFVHRVIGSVCCLESPPASRAPGSVVYGDAPLEYDLNLFPRRDPRSDLRRNADLTVRREFVSEVGGLHLCSLTSHIISRVRDNGRPQTLVVSRRPFSEWRVIRPEPSISTENVGKRWATRQDLDSVLIIRSHRGTCNSVNRTPLTGPLTPKLLAAYNSAGGTRGHCRRRMLNS